MSSDRRDHLKNCHKSGYQVKHSRYGSQSLYFQERPFALETNEEKKNGVGLMSEIKHLKSLLGSMAES